MQLKTLSSRIVYKNPVITVKEDKVIWPDGTEGVYAYTSVPRTVGIVAIDNNLFVYLCRQYRHIFKDESWEIPRGMVGKSETKKQAAKRELLEEAKLKSQEIKEIGSLRLSIGFLDEECSIFLARNVISVAEENDREHEIDEVRKFSFDIILSMIEENKILDGLTVAAILRTKQLLSL